MGNNFFQNSTSLVNVNIPDSIIKIGTYAFVRTAVAEIKIPGSIKDIGQRAFWYCENLKTVDIKEGVEQISSDAFSDCESLVFIMIPEPVKYFGSDARSGNTSPDKKPSTGPAAEGMIPAGAQLNMKIGNADVGTDAHIYVLDITLTNAVGNTVHPNGNVKVKMLLPENFEKSDTYAC